jgi:hypothetical protein
MSCKECEAVQKLAFDKNVAETVPIVYCRVGNANFALVGCEKHARIVVGALRGG